MSYDHMLFSNHHILSIASLNQLRTCLNAKGGIVTLMLLKKKMMIGVVVVGLRLWSVYF